MVFEHVQQHILPGMVVREERQPLLHKLSQSTPIIHPLLCAGEVQEMVWPTKVMLPPTGPLYLSDKEKVARHFDYSSWKTEEKKNTTEARVTGQRDSILNKEESYL